MALSRCGTCTKEVAVNAKTCPHCGAEDPAPSKGKAIFEGVASLIVLAGLIGGGWYGWSEYSGGKSMGVQYVKELRTKNPFDFIKRKMIEWMKDGMDPVPREHQDKSGIWKWGFRKGVKEECDRK